MTALIKSKKRVIDHGEVFTPQHIVDDMLDIVADEARRVESRFLDQACGNGNFLDTVLKRKLKAIQEMSLDYKAEFELNCIKAISTIYGVEILADNVMECRSRLFDTFSSLYSQYFADGVNECVLDSARFLIEKNIIHGDTLRMVTVKKQTPIFFCEWEFDEKGHVRRRDFLFFDLVSLADPKPIREFQPVHFLKLRESYEI